MKSRLLGPLAVLLALAVCALVLAPASFSDDSPKGRYVRGAADDTTTPFNLVSMPALIAHRYDGTDFHLVELLHRDPVADTWQIGYRGDGRDLSGTLLLPRRAGRHPLVVTMHGYIRPPLYRTGAGLVREERRLVRRGYAVLHPDYRNYGDSHTRRHALAEAPAQPLGYPADVLDAIAALRRSAPPDIDMRRVALFGRSMGGGVALQVAEARPSWFRGLLLYSPVSATAADDYRRWVTPDPSLRRRVEAAYGTPDTNPAFWHEASARSFVDRLTMPVSIHHGTADPVCPYRWSEHTATAMRRDGIDVTLTGYSHEVHRFQKRWPSFMHSADRFLAAALA